MCASRGPSIRPALIHAAHRPQHKLNVYTGEFIIQARIVAWPATSGRSPLRYQACDNNACMPPKTFTVAIDVIGK